jgi:hypothetical protein
MLIYELLNRFSLLLNGLLFELRERNIGNVASVFEVECLWPSLVFEDFAGRDPVVFLFEGLKLFVDGSQKSLLEHSCSPFLYLTHHVSLMTHRGLFIWRTFLFGAQYFLHVLWNSENKVHLAEFPLPFVMVEIRLNLQHLSEMFDSEFSLGLILNHFSDVGVSEGLLSGIQDVH